MTYRLNEGIQDGQPNFDRLQKLFSIIDRYNKIYPSEHNRKNLTYSFMCRAEVSKFEIQTHFHNQSCKYFIVSG